MHNMTELGVEEAEQYACLLYDDYLDIQLGNNISLSETTQYYLLSDDATKHNILLLEVLTEIEYEMGQRKPLNYVNHILEKALLLAKLYGKKTGIDYLLEISGKKKELLASQRFKLNQEMLFDRNIARALLLLDYDKSIVLTMAENALFNNIASTRSWYIYFCLQTLAEIHASMGNRHHVNAYVDEILNFINRTPSYNESAHRFFKEITLKLQNDWISQMEKRGDPL